MGIKEPKVDLETFQKDFHNAITLAMHLLETDYQGAVDFLVQSTSKDEKDVLTPLEFIRRGQVHAATALVMQYAENMRKRKAAALAAKIVKKGG